MGSRSRARCKDSSSSPAWCTVCMMELITGTYSKECTRMPSRPKGSDFLALSKASWLPANSCKSCMPLETKGMCSPNLARAPSELTKVSVSSPKFSYISGSKWSKFTEWGNKLSRASVSLLADIPGSGLHGCTMVELPLGYRWAELAELGIPGMGTQKATFFCCSQRHPLCKSCLNSWAPRASNRTRWCQNQWIGFGENLNRKPWYFYHQIDRGVRLKFSHHPILCQKSAGGKSLWTQWEVSDQNSRVWMDLAFGCLKMGQNPFLRRFFVRKRLNINIYIYIYIYKFNDDLWWFFPNSLLFWPVRHGSPWRALRRDPCQADQGTIRVGAPIDLCWGWWLNGEITKIYIYIYTQHLV